MGEGVELDEQAGEGELPDAQSKSLGEQVDVLGHHDGQSVVVDGLEHDVETEYLDGEVVGKVEAVHFEEDGGQAAHRAAGTVADMGGGRRGSIHQTSFCFQVLHRIVFLLSKLS